MNVRSLIMGLPLALLGIPTWAQVTTNGGTTNTVSMFTGNSAIGNSSITQDTNGNIHIPGILSASGPGGGIYLRTAPDGQQNTFVDWKLLHEGLLSGDGSLLTMGKIQCYMTRKGASVQSVAPEEWSVIYMTLRGNV